MTINMKAGDVVLSHTFFFFVLATGNFVSPWAGKRDLIAPEVAYINESLQPVPKEVHPS